MYDRLSGLEQHALLGRWAEGTIIVALWGFFDESGEHDNRGQLRRLTLGGFFARWDQVRHLCECWRSALDSEGLAEFHMKEIASDEDRFANWSASRQRRLTKFIDLLAGCAEEFGAFSYPVMKPRQAFTDTYETALARVLMVAANLAQRTGDQVRLVFAHTNEIRSGRIGEYFDGLRWEEYLAGYTVARSRDEPALQAAEIVARGLKRFMEDGTMSESFRRIVETQKPFSVWPLDPVSASRLIQDERRAAATLRLPS